MNPRCPAAVYARSRRAGQPELTVSRHGQHRVSAVPGGKVPFNRASVLLEGMGFQLGFMGHLYMSMYSVSSVGPHVWCRSEGSRHGQHRVSAVPGGKVPFNRAGWPRDDAHTHREVPHEAPMRSRTIRKQIDTTQGVLVPSGRENTPRRPS
jgi:hypothetical protein